jgi:hypothetical protein
MKFTMTTKKCQIDGCEKNSRSRGLCSRHYKQLPEQKARANQIRRKDFVPEIRTVILECQIEGCQNPHRAKGFCSTHYKTNHKRPAQLSACNAENCGKSVETAGLCRKHYQDKFRDTKKCSVEGCKMQYHSRGLCSAHYFQQNSIEKPCSVKGCGKRLLARGLCKTHYAQEPDQVQGRKEYKEYHREQIKDRRDLYQRAPHGKFVHNKNASKTRGLGWDLTEEQFVELNSRPCFYCGNRLPETGSGLDRIDNSKGYAIDNVASCCEDCNKARGDRFTSEEMKRHLGPAIKAIKEERIVIGLLTAKILLENRR